MADEPRPLSDAAETRVAAAALSAEASELSAAEFDGRVENEAVRVAEARVERAENTAADLAQAALNSEIGRQVAAQREWCESWRLSHEQVHTMLTTELASLREMLTAIQARLTETPPPITVVTETTSSDQSGSGTTTATVVNPSDGNDAPMPVENVAPARKRTRLI